MKIKNILGFAPTIQLLDGKTAKLKAFPIEKKPFVAGDKKVLNLPNSESGTTYLVNGMVYAASDRTDLAMFDQCKTVRGEDGFAVAQGGFITKDGFSHYFNDKNSDLA